MKIVPNLKNPKQTEYQIIFYYAKNALREKKALNPNFDYTCIYISVLLHQFCRNGTMLVCTFLLKCSMICKTSRIIYQRTDNGRRTMGHHKSSPKNSSYKLMFTILYNFNKT